MEDIIDDDQMTFMSRTLLATMRNLLLWVPINCIFQSAGNGVIVSGESVGINLVFMNYKIRNYDQEIKIRRIQALLEKEKPKNK
ncbi:MAG TPA: hypothetical protein VIS75_13870 [Chitinophagaceae bacterium]